MAMYFQIQCRAQKCPLSLVRVVPSWQLGCTLAAQDWWVRGRQEIQTYRHFFCTTLYVYVVALKTLLEGDNFSNSLQNSIQRSAKVFFLGCVTHL